jgi:uncharacterized membrane protein YgcG
VGIVAAGGAFLVLRWTSGGRDPGVGRVPETLQTPPSDLPAPIAGTLVDEVASQREAVATLVDLAERGIVDLRDEQNPALVGSHTDVRITLNAALDDSRLRGYERLLLKGLFGPRPRLPAEVLLSGVKEQFRSSIVGIETQLYESVAQQGLFIRNPETTRRTWLAIGFTLIAVGGVQAIGGAALLAGIIGLIWLPGAALVIIGVATTLLAGAMPRRTQLGALEAAKWRAFSKHLKDSVNGGSGTPHRAEYLPYAVAFGLDEDYVRHLESVGTPPPGWYRSGQWPGGIVFVPGGWYGGPARANGHAQQPQPAGGGTAAPAAPSPQGWSDALAGLLNAASQAMAHGGGSGGWSGGGFGGGGGGGGGGSGGFR